MSLKGENLLKCDYQETDAKLAKKTAIRLFF